MASGPFRLCADPVFQVLGVVVGLLVVVDRVDLEANGVDQSERGNIGADQELGIHAHGGGEGDEALWFNGLGDAVVKLVGDDADDLIRSLIGAGGGEQIGRTSSNFREFEGLADGIDAGEVFMGEGLVDDHHGCATVVFVGIPNAALEKRNTQDGEVFRADHVELRRLVFGCGLAVDFEFCIEAIGGRGGIAGDRDQGGSGNFGGFGLELLEVSGPLCPGFVRSVMDGDSDGHDVVRIVAERGVHQAQEAFDGGAGSSEHEEGEGDLPGNERVVDAPAADAAGGFAGVGLHDRADFGVGKLQGRPEAEKDSGDDGDGDAEDEDGNVDMNGGFVGEGIFGQVFDNDRDQPVSENQPEGCAGEREQQRLGEQLVDNAFAAGSNSGSDGEFLAARCCPCELQDRNVAAADGQQQCDRVFFNDTATTE